MSRHDLDHLRTFLVVSRTGSLTEAAALLGISQPTVTAHLRSLEAALGFAVLVRNRSGATLTRKGADLARDVAAHVDALDDITSLSAAAAMSPRALHLGGPAELFGEFILPRLGRLREAVRVPVHVSFGLAEPLLDDLRAGGLDVVVSATQPRLRGVDSVPLYDEEFLLVAAPEWAGDDASRLGEPELAAIPVIAYAANLPIVRRYWRTVFDRRPDALHIAAVIPDLRMIAAALRGGQGMSVLPRYLVADDILAGRLVELHRPDVLPLNTVHLATRMGEATRGGPVRSLLEALRGFFADESSSSSRQSDSNGHQSMTS